VSHLLKGVFAECNGHSTWQRHHAWAPGVLVYRVSVSRHLTKMPPLLSVVAIAFGKGHCLMGHVEAGFAKWLRHMVLDKASVFVECYMAEAPGPRHSTKYLSPRPLRTLLCRVPLSRHSTKVVALSSVMALALYKGSVTIARFLCRVLVRHSIKTLSSARQKVLDNETFADFFLPRSLCRV
jgi:hypothetical protein